MPRHAQFFSKLPLQVKSRFLQDMSTDEQEVDVFLHLLPGLKEKRMREQGEATEEEAGRDRKATKSQAGKGKGTWKSAKKKGGNPEEGSGDRRRNSSQVEMQQLLKGVAALCLRHEDSLSILHLDKGFVLFQKTKSPESLLQTMFSISTQWKKSKETGQVTSPLRVVLLKVLHHRASGQIGKGGTRRTNKGGGDKGRMGNSKGHGRTVLALLSVRSPTKTETVDINKTHKFHATRPLAEQYESDMISFLIHVALRGDLSEQLYRQLLQLEHNSVMFLMGARLRRERIQRSPLANHVAGLM